MKYHPDRYSDPVEKKEATAKFQQISAAYSVLRDREFSYSSLGDKKLTKPPLCS